MNEMFDILDQAGLDPIGSDAYCVDTILLMDGTESMSPIIENTKKKALSFCEKLHSMMEANGKHVDELRIKVMVFRDFQADGNQAMADSGFFPLPEKNDEYRDFVTKIRAMGGGDVPESALEAMALAMRSDWTKRGAKRRHVIAVFTDAPAVPLQDPLRMENPTYPKNMPATLEELGDMWAGVSQELGGMPESRSARLVLFTPNCYPWSDMQSWNNVWVNFSRAGEGLGDVDMDMALQLLVNSISD